MSRQAKVTRTTKETNVSVTLDLDSTTLPAGTTEVDVTLDGSRTFTLPVVVHDETVRVTNAGLSNVVAFDEPGE